MNILEFSALVGAVSTLAGFLGALTGLGGGVVLVPAPMHWADLPGEHALTVDGSAMGKGHKAALKPGATVDLSGKNGDLVYEVSRDERAHA